MGGAEAMKRIGDLSQLGTQRSLRFELEPAQGRFGPVLREGFAFLAKDGTPRAYLNVCPHRGQPVDVGDGRLFLADGNLECQAHGAVFDPASGACMRGPCDGRALQPIPITVQGNTLYLSESALDMIDE